MEGFFNQNNWFYKLMGLLFDLVILNVITLVVSIPLFTAGSALTALHYCLWRMVRNEEGSILKMYFTVFRENFKQVTPVWLVVLVCALIGAADVYFIAHIQQLAPGLGNSGRMVLIVAFSIMAVVITALVQWYTVLVSRYKNSNAIHLKNAALASLGFFPRTLTMLILVLGTAIGCVIFYGYAVPFVLILGISLPQYCCALVYEPVFKKLDGEESSAGSKK
ncbi:DUF624 domain-containing protein [Alloscardovia theropitheci]|uniref:DUF624 domain-containing protein n=1 Tax=Alloscardovia theropitheci TaxID=2496842 RepID=A0A4R0QPN5_9BIFI|nr:YesL family protein [Alloscardovia theropitheci]TCD54193.1 DUF624 domain-containing protein [Alloscardovia theropitheci]